MYRVFSAKRCGMAIKLTRAWFWYFWRSADYPIPFFYICFHLPSTSGQFKQMHWVVRFYFFCYVSRLLWFCHKNKACTLQPWIERGKKVWKSWNWAMDGHSLNVLLYTTECIKKRRRKPHVNCSIKNKFEPSILKADLCCGWVLS